MILNLLILLLPIHGFKMCGKYCGPNYCNGIFQTEYMCFEKITNKTEPLRVADDDVDNCCYLHDMCCGNRKTRGIHCNRDLVACISQAKNHSTCGVLKEDEIWLLFRNFLWNDVCGGFYLSRWRQLCWIQRSRRHRLGAPRSSRHCLNSNERGMSIWVYLLSVLMEISLNFAPPYFQSILHQMHVIRQRRELSYTP